MTMTKQNKKETNYTFVNEPLHTLVSARIRLTADERQAFKAAYREMRNASAPIQQTSPNGSFIKVEQPMFSTQELDNRLGMNQMLFTDLMTSRDSLNLTVLLRLQNVLGLNLITKERILNAAQSYVDYTFLKAEEA